MACRGSHRMSGAICKVGAEMVQGDQKERSPVPTVATRTRMVRRVLFSTGLIVLLATLLGYVAAQAIRAEGWKVHQVQQWWMQGSSAALLLWGTLLIGPSM
jgi:hypothetical protein